MGKVLGTILLFSFYVALSSQVVAFARADDLVVQDNGGVTLLVTGDGVLGITTTKQSAPQKNSPAPTQNKPSPPAKAVPLTSPKTESIVKINPPINNDKKVQVIITTNQTPAPQANPTISHGQTATPIPTQIPPPSAPAIVKTVDEVVAQGTNGAPVLTIKSDKANQLTIEQGTTQVTTSLPLQMNSLTHSLSISSQKQQPINVLPAQALQGVVDRGLLDQKQVNPVQINLTQDAAGGVTYTIESKKEGKLFNIIPVSSPIQVKLSAQTGKVIGASQSLIFSLFGGLIRR